ncbi:MAG TPA: zf-HC2 domain-containing protein [Agromyces sp.]|nr:zf-HC2 domain-containing protein [Agromyces sp.]
MNADHERYADWDSAYVLGALSPAERRDYEQHLESCESCRRSVAELTPIPGLLARLSPDRADALLHDGSNASNASNAPPAPRPELLDAVRREGRRRRLRRTRFRFAAIAAAAAVALVAVLVPLALLRPPADAQTVAFEMVADLPVTANATLTSVDWGTRIELDCRYDDAAASDPPDGGWPYALYVVDRDGDRSEISSWRANPGKTARLAAGTALDLDDIAALEIRSVRSGDVLLAGRTE